MRRTNNAFVVRWACVAFFLFGLGWPTAWAAPERVTITVLHTNDFHGYDPSTLPRRATLIRQFRAGAGDRLLVLDAGDVFTRGFYGTTFYGRLEVEAMNRMGYDAMTLGNNEFKAAWFARASQRVLADRVAQAGFDVLCANITRNGDPLPGVKPFTIKNVGGLRLGIVGVTAERVDRYARAAGLKVEPPLAAASRVIRALHDSGQVDAVLVLSHIAVDEDRRLAREVAGVAAIVGGDSHTVLARPIVENGVPIVQAGGERNGMYLGRLDLEFVHGPSGYRLEAWHGELIKLDRTVPPDPAIQEWLDGFLGPRKADSAA